MFKDKVIEVVKGIGKGEVMTYREVAIAAGSPLAARAVGQIMARNKSLDVPCHRVIRSDGSVGPYNGLLGVSKEEILRYEGYTGLS